MDLKRFRLKAPTNAATAHTGIARRLHVYAAIADNQGLRWRHASFADQFNDPNRIRFFTRETVTTINAHEITLQAQRSKYVEANTDGLICQNCQLMPSS